MGKKGGIHDWVIRETPIAVIDLETTGLTPRMDRIVEAAVVRVEPGKSPSVVIDTLINPLQPVSASEIHGITDADVAEAPTFAEVAGDIIDALEGCVVAAYNVYFDVKFLKQELRRLGIEAEPPHFCLMYMRPLLNLGNRCNLQLACEECGITQRIAHIAAEDALVSARLLEYYCKVLDDKGIETYGQLTTLKNYKFLKSFGNDPLSGHLAFKLNRGGHKLSRSCRVEKGVGGERHDVAEYWDALRTVLADLKITDDELRLVLDLRKRLKLPKETIRMLHAKAFAAAIHQFIQDRWLDDAEVVKLRRLFQCLSTLGWAPGE